MENMKKSSSDLIKESELLYRTIFESTGTAAIIIEEDTIISLANKEWVSLSGYSNEELEGKMSWTQFVVEEDLVKMIAYHKKRRQIGGDSPQKYEFRFIRRSGEIRDMINCVNMIPGSKRSIASLMDITERKQAENALFASEINHRLLLELAPDAFFQGDEKGNLILVNEKASSLTGYSKEELLTMNLKDLFSKSILSDRPLRYDSLNRGVTIFTEREITTKDGLVRVVEMNSKKMPNNTYQSFIRDVTDRKQAEVALRRSEAQFKAIFLKSPIGIGLSDSVTGKIYSVNPRFAEIVGRSHAEIEKLNWMQITHPDDVQEDIEKMQQLSAGIISSYQMEKRYILPNGDFVWVNMTIVPLIIEEISHTRNLCMIEDITDKKEYEFRLIKAKEKAEESDRLKSAFLANVSHEIRTPMNGILGFAELLKEPDLTGDDFQECVDVIEKSGNRMLNIINDIIEISKIESGLMSVNIVKTDISEQIDYVYRFFKPEADKKGLNFSVKSVIETSDEFIFTDKEKLFAIITNLVKNAIKYTNNGGIEIVFSLKKEDGLVFIQTSVSDTGIGIPWDKHRTIFDRFVQVEMTDTRTFQGAGLGLAITKAYVDMLGGKLWLESEVDKGSVFLFSLPSVDVSQTSSNSDLIDNGMPIRDDLKLKILIAEDDPISGMLIERAVKGISKSIIRVSSGIDAVNACKNNPDIDLLLTDVRMPLMNGYDAVRQIRQFNQKIVVIAQTAYALSGDKELSVEAGCTDYIIKPVSKDDLLELIYSYF